MTNEHLIKTVESMAEFAAGQSIKPATVKSRKHAKSLNKIDSAGRKWNVGDKYFLAIHDNRTVLIKWH